MCLKRFFPVLFIFVLWACDEEKEPMKDLGYEYFRISLGQTNVYAVDSIYHSAIKGTSDTVKCFYREIITNRTMDSFGIATYKADAYLSYDTAKGWKWVDYYFYRVDTNSVQHKVGNTANLIFVYPVIKNKKWNINSFNSKPEEFAYFRKVDFSFAKYLHCTEVVLKEEVNFIEERVLTAVYARDIGLISRYYSDVTIDFSKKDGLEVQINRL